MSDIVNHYDVTVVMPCLNEAETLASCIRKAQIGIEEAGVKGEIVISDNGSLDGSIDIARSPCTSLSSGSAIPKTTGSWCRYVKMEVDSAEKKGSAAITLPPGFNLLAERLRNPMGFFR